MILKLSEGKIAWNVWSSAPSSSQSRLRRRPTVWIVIHHMYLLYTSLHTLQLIVTSDIFMAIHILFYYLMVNFNQKVYGLILYSDSDTT